MSWRRSIIPILALTFLSITAGGWLHHPKSAADLEADIQRAHNAAKKAKLEVRLARLDVQQAGDAYLHNHPQLGQKLLGECLQEMNNSWAALIQSGRSATKRPEDYMDLEIGLRESARLVNDIRQNVSYTYQQPIKKIIGALNQLHSRVLLALFPGATPTPKNAGEKQKGIESAFSAKASHP